MSRHDDMPLTKIEVEIKRKHKRYAVESFQALLILMGMGIFFFLFWLVGSWVQELLS